MSLYILDTDCLSLYQRGHRQVISKLLSTPSANRAITIITVEEQLRGRLNQIRKARTTDKYIKACSALHDATRFFASIRIIDFSEEANSHFKRLRKVKPRIGTQDLRIAAIASPLVPHS